MKIEERLQSEAQSNTNPVHFDVGGPGWKQRKFK